MQNLNLRPTMFGSEGVLSIMFVSTEINVGLVMETITAIIYNYTKAIRKQL